MTDMTKLAVTMGSLSLLIAGQAQAQERTTADPPSVAARHDGEIIVTATKRDQRLIDVPIAITALSSADLARINADRFDDYVRTVPGLVYNQGGANSGSFAIRGISTSSLAGNTQSPVAIYIDDLPTLDTFGPLITTDLRLFDIQRVEVLRGPQGTLFGSGAMGGAIRIITNKPDLTQFSGRAEGTVETTRGGTASMGGNAMINLPLVNDSLALRLVGYVRRGGGYVDNATRLQRHVDRQESYGGRAQLKWQVAPAFSLLGTITYQNDRPRDSNYVDYNGSEYIYSGFAPQPLKTRSLIANLTGTLDLGWGTLTSSSTYNDRKDELARDFTGALAPLLSSLGFNGAPYPVHAGGPTHDFAQEVRLSSKGTSAFQCVVGAFYLNSSRVDIESVFSPGAGAALAQFGFPSDYLFLARTPINSSEVAGFGEANYTFGRWTATAGVRVFHDTIHVVTTADGLVNGGPTKIDRKQTTTSATPRFALAYVLDEHSRLYVQAANGYRVGQNNLTPQLDPVSGSSIPGTYGSDSLWNYEIGLKGRWLDGTIAANAAVFDIEWKRIQLQALSAAGFNYIANAGDARSRGAELELTILPARGLRLGTALAYTSTRLISVAANVDARRGDRLPGTPTFTASNYVQYEFGPIQGAKAYVRAEHQYFGKAFSNLNNATSLIYGDYHLFNARAGIDFARWGVALFVNNVGNSSAKVNAFKLPDGPAAIRLRPRTVGLTIHAGI